MDADRFDDVLRQWGSSRRPILGAGLGALMSLAGITPSDAKKKKKKKKCKSPRVKCGKVCCVAGETCQNGSCVSACPAGQTRCNGICQNGPCTPSCPAGLTRCGETCVDLLTDGANCGECGRVCITLNSCQQGRCPLACTGGQISCGGPCLDPDSDSENCGACGVKCSAGFSCQGGECRQATGTCAAGQDSCPGTTPISCSISGDVTDCACVKDLSGITVCARVALDDQLCGCQTDAECQSREFPANVGGGTYPNAVCIKSGSSGLCNDLCDNTNICAIPCQRFHDGN